MAGKMWVKAAWDYTANEEGELTFKVGDVIEVTAKDPSGWWTGTFNGAVGTFPNNFVEEYTPPAKKAAPPVAPRPSARAAAAMASPAAPSRAAEAPAATGPSRAMPMMGGGGSDPMAELRAKLAKRSTMAPAESSSVAAPAPSPARSAPGVAPRAGRATMAPAPSSAAAEPASPFGPGMLKRRAGGVGTGASASPAPAPSTGAPKPAARTPVRSKTVSAGSGTPGLGMLKTGGSSAALPSARPGPPTPAARAGRPAPGAPSPAPRAAAPGGAAPSPAPRPAARAGGAPVPVAGARAGLRPAGGARAAAPAPGGASAPTPGAAKPEEDGDEKAKAKAMYDYDAEEPGELSFKEGDVIVLLEKDESGWWQGDLNGTVGWFPATFAEEMPAEPKGPSVSELLSEATANVKLLTTTKKVARSGRRPPTRRKKAGTAVKSMRTETNDAPADLSGRTTIIGIGAGMAAALKEAGAARKSGGPTIPSGPQPEVNAASFPKLRKSNSPVPSGPTRAAVPSGGVDFRKNLRRTAAPRLGGDAASPATAAAEPAKEVPGLAKIPKFGRAAAPPAEAAAPPAEAAPGPGMLRKSGPRGGRGGRGAPRPAPSPAAAAPTPTAAAPSPAATPEPAFPKPSQTRAAQAAPEAERAFPKPSRAASAGRPAAAPAAAPTVATPKLPKQLGDYATFCAAFEELFAAAKAKRGGAVAEQPALAAASKGDFGAAICTVDGVTHSVGSASVPFSLQQACHPFLYALAGTANAASVASARPANADKPFELVQDKTPSALATAGALAVTSTLAKGQEPFQRSAALFSGLSKMAGAPVGCDMAAFLAAQGHEHEVMAQAYFLGSKGVVEDVDDTLSLYLQARSAMTSCESAAAMAATLANNGVSPTTQEQSVSAGDAKAAVAAMDKCAQGSNSSLVSLASHGGDSGCVVAVVPGVCGLAVYSPALGDEGLSTRAVELCNAFQAKFGL